MRRGDAFKWIQIPATLTMSSLHYITHCSEMLCSQIKCSSDRASYATLVFVSRIQTQPTETYSDLLENRKSLNSFEFGFEVVVVCCCLV